MKYIKYHLTLSILQARLWLLTFGFTLSFGALFAKTWQVYRIYTNSKLKNEVNCFVCLFVFLDYMICLPLCSFLPSLSPFILILLLLFPSSFLFSYLPPFLSPVLPISPPRFFLFAPPPSLPLSPSAFQDVEFPDHTWYFSTDRYLLYVSLDWIVPLPLG